MRRWCSTVVHSIAMCGFEKVASSISTNANVDPDRPKASRKSRERRAFLSAFVRVLCSRSECQGQFLVRPIPRGV